jgi:hypothetical protein
LNKMMKKDKTVEKVLLNKMMKKDKKAEDLMYLRDVRVVILSKLSSILISKLLGILTYDISTQIEDS